jgi:beta-galactosidase
MGTHPGVAYFQQSNADNLRYFADVLAWAGRAQQVRLSNPDLQARLHEGETGRFLWVVNATREVQTAKVVLARPASLGATFWANAGATAEGDRISVPARDVLIVRLD